MDGKPVTQNSFLNANCRLQYYVGGKAPASALEGSCGKPILADDTTSLASRIGENIDINCLPPWINQTTPTFLKTLADGSTVQMCDFWRPFKITGGSKVVPL